MAIITVKRPRVPLPNRRSKPLPGTPLKRQTRQSQMSGLVAFYPFLEGAGLATANYADSARPVKKMGTNIAWTPARSGRAVSFATSGAIFDTGSDTRVNAVTGTVTMSAWIISSTASSAGVYPRVMSKLQSGTFNGFELVRAASDAGGGIVPGSIYIQLANAGVLRGRSDTVAMPLNQWNHYVGVYNATSGFIGIYRNGRLVSSTTTVTTANNTSSINLHIGSHPSFDRWLGGSVDLCAVWNRQLTSEEIYELYNDPYLLFEEDTGVGRSIFTFSDDPIGVPMRRLALAGAASPPEPPGLAYRSGPAVHSGVEPDAVEPALRRYALGDHRLPPPAPGCAFRTAAYASGQAAEGHTPLIRRIANAGALSPPEPPGSAYRPSMFITGLEADTTRQVYRRVANAGAKAPPVPGPWVRRSPLRPNPTGESLQQQVQLLRRYALAGAKAPPEPQGAAYRTAAQPTGEQPPSTVQRRPILLAARYPFPPGHTAGHRRVFHTGQTPGDALAAECPYRPIQPDVLAAEPTRIPVSESDCTPRTRTDRDDDLIPRPDECR